MVLWVLIVPTALAAKEPPGERLDLSCWKLTLPADVGGRGRADEIKQPELKSFQDPKHFFVNGADDSVVFRAHCGGSTTKGSKYPRCELREMSGRGDTPAAWSTDDRKMHSMIASLAITRTPPVKKHMVCAQIHDATDDLLMIRLEGRKLFIERRSGGDVLLDPNYSPGARFDLKIEAGQGQVKVWYDGLLKLDWKVSRSGCYFKAGCYTQSNVSRGDAPDSYGEVVIHRLEVLHQKLP